MGNYVPHFEYSNGLLKGTGFELLERLERAFGVVQLKSSKIEGNQLYFEMEFEQTSTNLLKLGNLGPCSPRIRG